MVDLKSCSEDEKHMEKKREREKSVIFQHESTQKYILRKTLISITKENSCHYSTQALQM